MFLTASCKFSYCIWVEQTSAIQDKLIYITQKNILFLVMIDPELNVSFSNFSKI